MKQLNLFFALLMCVGFLNAQNNNPSIVEITYLDIHPSKISTFVTLKIVLLSELFFKSAF